MTDKVPTIEELKEDYNEEKVMVQIWDGYRLLTEDSWGYGNKAEKVADFFEREVDSIEWATTVEVNND